MALCAQMREVIVPGTLVRSSPLSLPQVDEALRVLVQALPALDGAERGALLLEIDRLLDIRLTLTRTPVEAGE
jgi:hypothetical protein